MGRGYKISKWDAKYPRILCMGVQNILGYFVGGYKILRGTKYPVTPVEISFYVRLHQPDIVPTVYK